MEEDGKLSHLELTSMLDTLGSTLSRTTVDTFFTRHGKKPLDDELTYSEAIQCLEEELDRPDDEKKRIESDDSSPSTNGPSTPGAIAESESTFMKLSLGELDFSLSIPHLSFDEGVDTENGERMPRYILQRADSSSDSAMDNNGTMSALELLTSPKHIIHGGSPSSSDVDAEAEHEVENPCVSSLYSIGININAWGSSGETVSFERVINVKTCPLCHRPRMNAKAEVDIVTHLAVCASQDWAKVDRIVSGNYVTASQAQRKWYTKIITKVSSGNYKLGAVSLPELLCCMLVY